MRTIEERLQEHQQIMTPSELEGRLRTALERVPVKTRTRIRVKTWVASAVAAFILTVGIYQYPAFAYYGGKLFSKSELDTMAFAELADHGYGQSVHKSKTLDDGTVITINGVIADDNALTMYYSIDPASGSIYTGDFPAGNYSLRYGVDKLEGFLTDSDPLGGSGGGSKDGTRYEGVYKFEPASPFSRTLTVTFSERLENGTVAHYPVSFKFEANKAMKSLLTADISQAVPVDQGTVHYDSITASPTSTLVKGHYELEDGETPRFSAVTKLYVNGIEVNYWSMRSARSGKTGLTEFEIEYDVLPTDKLQTVELVLDNFTGYEQIEQPVSLAAPSDRSILLGEEKLWIRSVTRTGYGYDIVIAGKQFTFLDTETLAVQAGGTTVPVTSISQSRPWDLKNGNILWERTYSFNTEEAPQFLLLDGFHYIKTYDETITVPTDGKKH
ncbi:DUF4179 domain-containing protein [Paenibacillus sp. FSL R5-0912]|uniref:DUF4179 domain-containing protein n=1 Tax=Paenibacillus sp. FSL R5-0912 TaxID=1536771 RepID=UPI0004F5E7BA|nr:DUF4179 domain-containing protein [Paenibacillus sp. FSL R5-0912]AIQ40073.1 hypothetical protein R50912_08530 [Paenibacillus sp. FSL R5-0912]